MILVHSFRYALKGVYLSLAERNTKIHIVISLIVIFLGIFFRLAMVEWAVLILCIGLVFLAELMNSAVEKVCDAILAQHQNAYPVLGAPKDLAAGAVFMAALTAAVVGILIFWPHVATFLTK